MDNFRKVLYFIGIGGISMSSLAAIAKINGHTVYGSDRHSTPIIVELTNMGIDINLTQVKENIENLLKKHDPSEITAIYTSAISEENPEIVELKKHNIPLVHRAVFLGELMRAYNTRIGIAGTHGKSTTTALVDLILESNNSNPTMLEGAITKENNKAYKIGSNEYFVFEACEYCNSFLSFYPTTAAVTNVDFDHADFFHSTDEYVESFRKYIALANIAVVNLDSINSKKVCDNYSGKLFTCSIVDSSANYFATNIVENKGLHQFDIIRNGDFLCHVSLSVAGLHVVSDALVAAAACYENGCSAEAISNGLNRFIGIKRRMELIKEDSGILYFDDYAHHPEEIKATLSAAKAMGGRIICAFQPHSLSRTAELFDDFTQSFVDADVVVFADIYENLEQDKGNTSVTSKMLSERVGNSCYFDSFEKIAEYINKIKKPGDIIIAMGAGDINKLINLI